MYSLHVVELSRNWQSFIQVRLGIESLICKFAGHEKITCDTSRRTLCEDFSIDECIEMNVNEKRTQFLFGSNFSTCLKYLTNKSNLNELKLGVKTKMLKFKMFRSEFRFDFSDETRSPISPWLYLTTRLFLQYVW